MTELKWRSVASVCVCVCVCVCVRARCNQTDMAPSHCLTEQVASVRCNQTTTLILRDSAQVLKLFFWDCRIG